MTSAEEKGDHTEFQHGKDQGCGPQKRYVDPAAGWLAQGQTGGHHYSGGLKGNTREIICLLTRTKQQMLQVKL